MTAAPASRAAGGEGGAFGARHVAIIMDGNGRWAKARRLPRLAGHRQGVEAVRRTVRAAGELGLEALTLYAFSSENWRRPPAEIADLMGLLHRFVRSELREICANNVRLRLIGELSRLDPELVALLDDACRATAANTGLTLVVALNYGSQDEIARAARMLAQEVAEGRRDPASITPEAIGAALQTAGLPPLDLLIRTSGEVRLSNFLLWQAAYAELLFVDTLWPDFDGEALARALEAFGARQRRYGGL